MAFSGTPISGTAKKLPTRLFRIVDADQHGDSAELGRFFFARVEVCNSSSGELTDSRDYGLCTKYPSGKYKPTGVIQKYSDQLRLAAFGCQWIKRPVTIPADGTVACSALQ